MGEPSLSSVSPERGSDKVSEAEADPVEPMSVQFSGSGSGSKDAIRRGNSQKGLYKFTSTTPRAVSMDGSEPRPGSLPPVHEGTERVTSFNSNVSRKGGRLASSNFSSQDEANMPVHETDSCDSLDPSRAAYPTFTSAQSQALNTSKAATGSSAGAQSEEKLRSKMSGLFRNAKTKSASSFEKPLKEKPVLQSLKTTLMRGYSHEVRSARTVPNSAEQFSEDADSLQRTISGSAKADSIDSDSRDVVKVSEQRKSGIRDVGSGASVLKSTKKLQEEIVRLTEELNSAESRLELQDKDISRLLEEKKKGKERENRLRMELNRLENRVAEMESQSSGGQSAEVQQKIITDLKASRDEMIAQKLAAAQEIEQTRKLNQDLLQEHKDLFDKISNLRKELKATRTEEGGMRKELQRARHGLASVNDEFEASLAKLKQTNDELEETGKQLADANVQLVALQKEQNRLEEELRKTAQQEERKLEELGDARMHLEMERSSKEKTQAELERLRETLKETEQQLDSIRADAEAQREGDSKTLQRLRSELEVETQKNRELEDALHAAEKQVSSLKLVQENDFEIVKSSREEVAELTAKIRVLEAEAQTSQQAQLAERIQRDLDSPQLTNTQRSTPVEDALTPRRRSVDISRVSLSLSMLAIFTALLVILVAVILHGRAIIFDQSGSGESMVCSDLGGLDASVDRVHVTLD